MLAEFITLWIAFVMENNYSVADASTKKNIKRLFQEFHRGSKVFLQRKWLHSFETCFSEFIVSNCTVCLEIFRFFHSQVLFRGTSWIEFQQEENWTQVSEPHCNITLWYFCFKIKKASSFNLNLLFKIFTQESTWWLKQGKHQRCWKILWLIQKSSQLCETCSWCLTLNYEKR